MAKKTEAEFEAEAQAAALGLARLRRPKLEAAQSLIADLAGRVPELSSQRDALHDGAARQALSNLISVITSAEVMVMGEIGGLAKEPAE